MRYDLIQVGMIPAWVVPCHTFKILPLVPHTANDPFRPPKPREHREMYPYLISYMPAVKSLVASEPDQYHRASLPERQPIP